MLFHIQGNKIISSNIWKKLKTVCKKHPKYKMLDEVSAIFFYKSSCKFILISFWGKILYLAKQKFLHFSEYRYLSWKKYLIPMLCLIEISLSVLCICMLPNSMQINKTYFPFLSGKNVVTYKM
jgi:hypothetical protein